MKAIIIAVMLVFSFGFKTEPNLVVPNGGATCGTIDEGCHIHDGRCWEGNCVLHVDEHGVTQECDTFCNYKIYKCNFIPECDGETCWNTWDYCILVDEGPYPR